MARSLRMRNQVIAVEPVQTGPATILDRPRRTATAQQKSYQETDDDDDEVDLDEEDDEEDDEEEEEEEEEEDSITVEQVSAKQPTGSIKLKLKMPPSKLRESTLGKGSSLQTSTSAASPDTPSGSRSTRVRRQVVMESESEEEDEDEEDFGGDDAEDDDDDDDAEGVSDVEMDDLPPPPIIRKTGPAAKPTITITSAAKPGKVKSVEAKEISMATGDDFDDDDLSDLSDEDADGDIAEEDALEDDAEGDSFDEEDLSRAGTPDLTKMTKRQRALADVGAEDHFMALNMGPQARLHLTDEQRNFRRVEMARRRKNLSEKRNEEEKQDTINRLLKKQAPKRRGKISAAEIAAGAETPDIPMGDADQDVARADPVYTRWISGPKGMKLGIPVEWKDKFVSAELGNNGWKMVEEVE